MPRQTFPCVKASAIDDLVDAGPIVGLLSETDPWHASSHSVLTVLDVQLATTALVWGEIGHRLRKDRVALFAAIAALETGRIVLLPVWGHVSRIRILIEKYPQMDAGDASLGGAVRTSPPSENHPHRRPRLHRLPSLPPRSPAAHSSLSRFVGRPPRPRSAPSFSEERACTRLRGSRA